MAGLDNLEETLRSMVASCDEVEYGFATIKSAKGIDLKDMQATFKEREGLAVIAPKDILEAKGIKYEGPFAKITIDVHTSLDMVGLTAALATELAKNDISANVVAAYFHDHIFVQYDLRQKAMDAINYLKIDNI